MINLSWSINTWGLDANDESLFKTGIFCAFNAWANLLGYLLSLLGSNLISNVKPLNVFPDDVEVGAGDVEGTSVAGGHFVTSIIRQFSS